MKTCVGCRTCIIACSYHHRDVFSRAISSIEVKSSEEKGKFEVIIYRSDVNGHLACDRCVGLDEHFCVKHCPAMARNELKDLVSVESG